MKKRLLALLLLLTLLVPASIASAATYYRVNTGSLQVRQFPSESARVLGSYRRDYVCTIQSRNGNWAYVVFSNGFEGYVWANYLKKVNRSYNAWVYKDKTNLRKGPDGSFAATAILAKGRKVKVISHGEKYDYVYAGSLGYGYIVNSLLSKKYIKPSGNASYSTQVTGGDYYAWVFNAGNRKVNLRSYASEKAPIIASYSTGTKVYVLSHGSTWDLITVDGYTGYMMTKYLSTSAPAPTPTPTPTPAPDQPYTAYVVSENKKPVSVLRGPGQYALAFRAPYGAEVTVLKHNVEGGTKWDYIEYLGKKGYIKNKYLQLAMPTDAPIITPTPTPAPTPVFPYQAVIYAANGKPVNVHKKPYDSSSNVDGIGRLEVGTEVTVLGTSKGWSEIRYNKLTGYVHNEFLKKLDD